MTKDFNNIDLWARDNYGDKIPYFKGRSVTCINNPQFIELHLDRIRKTTKQPFNGIYIDNIQMGQMTMVYQNQPLTFFGCNCEFCNRVYFEETGNYIPAKINKLNRDNLEKYIEWRAQCTTKHIRLIRETIGNKKELGTNFIVLNLTQK